MELKLQRQATVAGTTLEFTFDVAGSLYLVKNFTEGDIYVSFEPDDPNKVLIPADTAQLVQIGWGDRWNDGRSDKVYVTPDEASTKGVEVQCLRW